MSESDTAIVWRPSPEDRQHSEMARFMRQVAEREGVALPDYAALWSWSVAEPGAFWDALWRFCDVIASRPADTVVDGLERMPGARWFPGARLNFAQNLLRYRDDRPAIVFEDEDGHGACLSHAEVHRRAARVAHALHREGIGVGDRVAAVVPNTPEAVIAMLGVAWVGATWASCSPDFGPDAIIDRFGQVAPRLLIGVDGYSYKGRRIDLRDRLAGIRAALPDAPQAWLMDRYGLGGIDGWDDWAGLAGEPGDGDRVDGPPPFAQLPFDHPLYILFSSGTTGRPKCIVHGAGGTLLQHLKEHRLHTDITRDDRLFYYTTTGWMMWNWLVSGLASGCTLVLYDGSPVYPDDEALWRLAARHGVTVFGTSAGFVAAQARAGVDLAGRLPLPALRTVLSTGSPLAPASFDWLQRAVRPGVQVSSISGGTDIVSCFALGNPLLPVRRGEIQCRGLGMAVAVFDEDGQPLVGEPGELVCTRPFPSMPLGFWGDASGERFRDAYFARYPGVWTHGDWTTLTPDGGLVITGRSDAVLNPGGVRIGTAEIYRQVERLPEIVDSVCIGQPWQDDVRVVLFVVLAAGEKLTDTLCERIRRVLREQASPRHVPARIVQVDGVPRTRSGKVSEIAVRDVVAGRPVANTDALANPEVLAQYRDRAELR
jgi:acetoacetyl-CoA synthetase